MKKAGIIGAGVAGLAISIRLALKGYAVDVYEANNYTGGKLSELQVGPYRFDAGPSLFTMPQFLEDLFALAGKNFSAYCPYRKLDVITNYFYEDGIRFSSYADTRKFVAELEHVLGVDQNRVLDYLQTSHRLYDSTFNLFLNHSLHRFQDISMMNLLKAGRQFSSLNLFSTMHEVNAKKLKHEKLVQYFDRFATYNGSDPYQCPGTLNVIPHLEHNVGAYFPDGGMIAIAKAMLQLAIELGVKFYMEHQVQEVIIKNNQVAGLISEQKGFEAYDVVVSNMDIVPTYKKLLPSQKHPEKILNQPRSSSALIFYWGIRQEFKELGLHNIFFSEDYKTEFSDIFKRKQIPADPTVYINISSKYKKDDAPPGGENWFVMINVPNNEGQDWDAGIALARKNILEKISRHLNTNIESLIETASVMDPRNIEANTSSFRGALYGSSSNNRMSAFLRHPNFSSDISGLYFCGGSVHPGGGIPLCLLSAKITDEIIDKP